MFIFKRNGQYLLLIREKLSKKIIYLAKAFSSYTVNADPQNY